MMNTITRLQPQRYRTIWLSDIHLGYKGCKADYLLDFLRSTECEYLFLVGDIFDVWSMKRRGLFWPQSHNNVIRTILGKSKHNTKVIYIPGNHDEVFRDYDGLVDNGYEIYFPINYDKRLLSSKANINVIESFWSFSRQDPRFT